MIYLSPAFSQVERIDKRKTRNTMEIQKKPTQSENAV